MLAYNRGAPSTPPWAQQTEDPAEVARRREHAERLRLEDRARERALGEMYDRPAKYPEPKVQHPAAGTFEDPDTKQFVADAAAAAVAKAVKLNEGLQLGMIREGDVLP